MQDEQDPLKRQEYLGMQEQKMQRLDSFISDILDYSRNARMFISEDIIDFDAFFKQCLEMNRFSSDAKDVNISIEVNQKVPFVSDKARLLVIFNNLISNSIRYQKLYNDDKKLNIKVNVTASDLSVEILDNGIGIMEEHIKKIFDMFYRATSQKPGSGLGLYIVKDAVEKLGGIIAVASKYGEGTRFTFSIPNKKSST